MSTSPSLRAMEANYVPAQAHHGAEQELFPQFEDIDQQNECYVVGMWTFLVTEIMFFGTLFLAYAIYRTLYHEAYLDAHHFLNVFWGTLNTFILLTSSYTMVMAVWAAQQAKKWLTIAMLAATIVCSFGFLGIKYIEYSTKIHEGLFPGYGWNYTKALRILEEEHGGGAKAGGEHGTAAEGGHGTAASSHEGPAAGHGAGHAADYSEIQPGAVTFDRAPKEGFNAMTGTVPETIGAPVLSAEATREETRGRHARLFFSIYFTMTGLHGVHVLIGILMMAVLIVMYLMNHKLVRDYIPTELIGLYWHFVDIVWIFLFPMMYLIS
ncbi:MAG: cytochrome c oxidase subunit 3 [Capsulimonadales bacterium]|nr:cytochrome c oxidase subunit 3 [Capsulimonadales bacterium]